MSSGARITPATLAAEIATRSEAIGEGESRTSIPPAYVRSGIVVKDRPGSGRARKAEKNDLRNDVTVDRSIE